jgi:hypothetical protein
MSLTAFAINCSLKASGDKEQSSTDKLIADLLTALQPHGGHRRSRQGT